MTSRRKTAIAISAILIFLLSVLFFFYIRADILFYLEDTLRRRPAPDLTAVEVEGGDEYTLSELVKHENAYASSLLMLVNRDHPLPLDYVPLLEEYNGAKMHPLMVDHYIALRDRVEGQTGVRIYVSSDYRTSEEQEEILLESGEGVAAPVGASEHEAGLSLDVYAPYFAGEEFLRSPAGRAVNRLCSDHGFIIRYPRNKEDVTKISYEPWHLRYVGAPHAKIITKSGLALEEYLPLLTPETWFCHEEYYILRTASDRVTLPEGWETCDISPDNLGYTVLTVKMPSKN